MRLIAASIREVPGAISPWEVDLTWETLLVSRNDWRTLHEHMKFGDIPKQISVETRSYASREIAESAVVALGGKLDAA